MRDALIPSNQTVQPFKMGFLLAAGGTSLFALKSIFALFIFFIFYCSTIKTQDFAEFNFIPNKGQWQNDFRYKVKVD